MGVDVLWFSKKNIKKETIYREYSDITRRKRECLILNTLNIFLYVTFVEMNYLLIQKFKEFTLQMIDHVA